MRSRPTSTAPRLDRVSILDFDAYEDTNLNWRVRRGYGALMAAYGASLPVAFNCAVTLIDHSAKRLRIETSQGTLQRRQGHRHRADQPDRRRSDPLSPCAARQGRCRGPSAAWPRRQGGAGARRAGGAAEGRQSARRHHAHGDGDLSSAPVRPALHRRLFRRPLCARARRRRRRRDRRRIASTRSRASSATTSAAS